jgi:hypothetical protein
MKRSTHSHVRKPYLLWLAATSIALAGPVTAAAASKSGADPIRVTGTGVRAGIPGDPTPFMFSFDAAAPAASNGMYGTFSGSFPHDPYFRNGVSAPGNFATFSGVVTCLQFNGETATIGGIFTSGYGYTGDPTTPDLFSQDQRDLVGNWFIATAQDPKSDKSPDTIGFVDWGDSNYFLSAGYGYTSFTSMCNDPAADLGTSQFPLASGDLNIRH